MKNIVLPDTKINPGHGGEKVTQDVTLPTDPAAAAAFLAMFGTGRQLCTLDASGQMKGLRGSGMLLAANKRNQNQEAVYFTPNTVVAELNKKPSSAEITHINSVYIDLDWGWAANAGNFPAAHAAVMLKAEGLKELSCPPSVIVSTGGGIQAFWITPEPLEAKEFKARAVELNKTLAGMFGGDAVHSIDHAFRLPGFVNYPKKDKRDAGQLPALVMVIFESDRRYTIGELETAFQHAGGDIAPERKKTAVASPESFLESLPESFWDSPLRNGGGAGLNDMAAGIGPDMNELVSLAASLEGKLGDRGEWFKFANPMANLAARFPLLHQDLRNLFDKTSATSPKYDPAAVRAKFDELVAEAHKRLAAGDTLTGMTTLRGMAEKHGWVWPPEDAQSELGAADGAGSAGSTAGSGGAAPFVGKILKLQRNKHGHPFVNWANTKRCLQWAGVHVWRDLFGHKIYIAGDIVPPDYVGILMDGAAVWARGWIFERCGFDPGTKNIFEAMESIAEDNRRNPVTDTLDSLVWDGVDRSKTWLPRVTGCVDTPLHRATGTTVLEKTAQGGGAVDLRKPSTIVPRRCSRGHGESNRQRVHGRSFSCASPVQLKVLYINVLHSSTGGQDILRIKGAQCVGNRG